MKSYKVIKANKLSYINNMDDILARQKRKIQNHACILLIESSKAGKSKLYCLSGDTILSEGKGS